MITGIQYQLAFWPGKHDPLTDTFSIYSYMFTKTLSYFVTSKNESREVKEKIRENSLRKTVPKNQKQKCLTKFDF